ncbi:MAG: hypothetical protein WKF84_13535 [Pyrinomonadaceae bacterium]
MVRVDEIYAAYTEEVDWSVPGAVATEVVTSPRNPVATASGTDAASPRDPYLGVFSI